MSILDFLLMIAIVCVLTALSVLHVRDLVIQHFEEMYDIKIERKKKDEDDKEPLDCDSEGCGCCADGCRDCDNGGVSEEANR